MRKYFDLLIEELAILGIVILAFAPGVVAISLGFEVSYWYFFILLLYIPLIPLIIVILKCSYFDEYIDL